MSVNEQQTEEQQKHETADASNEQPETEVQPEDAAQIADDASESEEDPRYAELARQAEDYQQRFLRAQADFDNFRRRTMKEKEELGQYASMKLIGQLLPVVDNFGRAIEAAKGGGDVESFSKGVDMIFRQLEQVLEQEGLKPMEAVGQPFNPEFHQAIMQVESEEHEEGIVIEEVQKGYMLKDKVLRPAMVKVSG
ncbi:nucleotide exchange factor GrpE [Paenibacillus sp. sptzw28]|uniref:nucleotide exchange factor GrpE n=1 Tax=Paenibacillus sp. sptzw28 TaxID=715179 RepID=UPI001C6F12B2|nr:nucleotide exchange factor GrpE [Paenibacillus sp. sptzw28]QYR20160.1 nucleotide exchange factor GrpE [Paenibacillus sp. sptzw28]